MNIEEAKTIPMCEFLKKLNILPYRDYSGSALYKAPHRKERTASLRVSKVKNAWYDHGTGQGGSFFQFIIELLKSQKEDHTASDALRFINKIWNNQMVVSYKELAEQIEPQEYKLKLELISELKYPPLLSYLNERGISNELGNKYFRQADLLNTNTNKKFKAIAFPNENEGYELRNRIFKGCVNGKDISFVRGTAEIQENVHVFEGMMDFVSALTILGVKQLPDDAIVLNSLACLPKAFPFITDYTYKTVYSWLDNDDAGERHRQILHDFVSAQNGLKHISFHRKYKDYNDVNEWLVNRPNIN